MIAANGRRRDWLAGNAATLYLELHVSAAPPVEEADAAARQTDISGGQRLTSCQVTHNSVRLGENG